MKYLKRVLPYVGALALIALLLRQIDPGDVTTLLGAPQPFAPTDVTLFPGYGPGYARPYEPALAAIALAARAEGLLLDPVYSGKAMAGLIDLIRTGQFTADQHVVFLHTGGWPSLFATLGPL